MVLSIRVLAILLVVAGALCVAQGADLLRDGLMAGDRRWLIIGIPIAIAGLAARQFAALRER